MELLEALRIIRNQKKLVIPLLIIAFLAAGIMVTRMDTSYETHGTITLLNSNANSTDNPYLRFDQSLQTTAQVLGGTVSTADARASYEEKGLSPNYEVSVPYDPTRTILLPMLDIKVVADSAEVASSTRDALINDIKDELARKQTEAGAPVDSWIQAFPIADREVVPVSGSKARTFVIVFGLGAAFAIAAAFIVDGFKRGVKNTRRGETIVLEKPTPLRDEASEKSSSTKRTRTSRPKRTSANKKPESNSITKPTTDSNVTL